MAGKVGRPQDWIVDELAAAGARIGPVLEELLPRDRYDFISEPVWYHLGTGGKRIRPAICILACERLGGDPARAVHFAAAVEILHNMFLVHDDVEDGDTVRRDQPAVWVQYGLDNAINVGDYLLAVAYRAILMSPVEDETKVRLARTFTDVFETTCAGQALDMNYRAREDLTIEQYLRMVTLKTGRYLALGMVGGGIAAGASEDVLAGFDALGESMGAAFQIRDDMIDLTMGKGRGGVTGNDIREGKSSILYAHALSVAGEEVRRDLVAIMRKPRAETTPEDVERVRRIYADLGSMEYAQAEADRLVERAFATIDRIPVEDKEFFRELTRYMVSRTT